MTVLEGVFGGLRPTRDEAGQVGYRLVVGDAEVDLATLVGRDVAIEWCGDCACEHCAAPLPNLAERARYGGVCRRCFFALPQCDRCFRSPEHCHFAAGTCRDPAWGERVCFSPHIVYLAETSAPKVGITRAMRREARWLEQGAMQARVFAEVTSRRAAGHVEALLRGLVGDRTQWRAMLARATPGSDLGALARTSAERFAGELDALNDTFGDGTIVLAPDASPTWWARYPLPAQPGKIASLRLTDTAPRVAGRVLGAKGRYLVLDRGAFNTASHDGLPVRFALDQAAARSGGDPPAQHDLFG